MVRNVKPVKNGWSLIKEPRFILKMFMKKLLDLRKPLLFPVDNIV